MTPTTPWADIDAVSDWIGIDPDTRMEQALVVADDWAKRCRPDLVAAQVADPDNWTPPPAVSQAVTTYAGILWRERTTPSGFATYDELAASGGDVGMAMANVYRLLGNRKPVAR